MLPLASLWQRGAARSAAPLILEVPASQVSAELAALDPSQTLVRQGPFDVVLARASQIPALMLEIGRVREETFRHAGEGTGKRYDLDRFDEHYEHLALWDRVHGRVAGSCRLASTADTLARMGRAGLYTTTLFHLGAAFFRAIGPAVELGRSFVHPAYQRKPHSLLLLWRGIGRYLELRPECRALFGPVSISGTYTLQGRQMIARFLAERAAADEPLRRCARARRPLRQPWPQPWLGRGNALPRAASLEEADELLRLIGGPEAKRGMPVLLRQYLKLGGQVVCCSVDPAFNHCLDALVVLDLRIADHARLIRMLGFDPSGDAVKRGPQSRAAGGDDCAIRPV
ncbi:MAG: GNAT family N-acyltransferase [Bryobacteraceae bacterium]